MRRDTPIRTIEMGMRRISEAITAVLLLMSAPVASGSDHKVDGIPADINSLVDGVPSS